MKLIKTRKKGGKLGRIVQNRANIVPLLVANLDEGCMISK